MSLQLIRKSVYFEGLHKRGFSKRGKRTWREVAVHCRGHKHGVVTIHIHIRKPLLCATKRNEGAFCVFLDATDYFGGFYETEREID